MTLTVAPGSVVPDTVTVGDSVVRPSAGLSIETSGGTMSGEMYRFAQTLSRIPSSMSHTATTLPDASAATCGEDTVIVSSLSASSAAPHPSLGEYLLENRLL